MKLGPKTTIFLAVMLGVSVIGFLRGTDSEDYELQPPLVIQEEQGEEEGVPHARAYAELRDGTTSDGSLVAQTCTDCHKDRLQASQRGARTEHPIGIKPPAGADLSRLFAAGGRLQVKEDGTEEIVCQTCHRPHNATQDARLIVTTDEGALCLSCHTDHAPSRSQHPVSMTLTSSMKAAIESIGGAPGDRLTCLSCHDPHESTAGTLLRTDGSKSSACQACHKAERAQLGPKGHGGQACEDCHGMHRASALVGKGPTSANIRDQPCADCHAGRPGKKAQINLAKGHPMWKTLPPELADRAEGGILSCSTCHVAHSSAPKLLVKGSVEKTCLSCHEDKASVIGTDHDASVVAVNGESAPCLSCHAVHGKSTAPAGPAGVNPVIARCLSCHDGRTSATKVANWEHPKGLLLTAAGLPFRYAGPVPYFGPDGRKTTQREAGEIACLTCHDPHKWKHGVDAHPGAVDGSEQDSFLRDSDGIVGFCSVCHGQDALPRFRFFHGEQFRKDDEEQ